MLNQNASQTRIATAQAIIQPVAWGVAGLLIGRAIDAPCIAGAGVLCGAAFGAAVSVEIAARMQPVERTYPNLGAEPLYMAETVAVETEPGEGVFIHGEMFGGLPSETISTIAALVLADGKFATEHYQIVAGITRPDYARFRHPFQARGWCYLHARQYHLNAAGRAVCRRLL